MQVCVHRLTGIGLCVRTVNTKGRNRVGSEREKREKEDRLIVTCHKFANGTCRIPLSLPETLTIFGFSPFVVSRASWVVNWEQEQSVYMFVYVCVRVCVSLYVCVYVCVCLVYVCVCVRVYEGLCVCMYVYIYMCVYVYVGLCLCLCLRVHVFV